MSGNPSSAGRGFTLVELLCALLVLSLLALMSYRGLGAVLDTRAHLNQENAKWRRVEAFFARFEQDLKLAAPRSVRTASGTAAAWQSLPPVEERPGLEFSRFAYAEDTDTARRVAYRLNERREIELLVWAGLDVAPGVQPARYALLPGVSLLELHYMGGDLAWANAWPRAPGDTALPRAVRIRIVLATQEEIVRVFGLRS